MMLTRASTHNKNEQIKPRSSLISQALLLMILLQSALFVFADDIQSGLSAYDMGEFEPAVSHFVAFAVHEQARFKTGLAQMDYTTAQQLLIRSEETARRYGEKLQNTTKDWLDDLY